MKDNIDLVTRFSLDQQELRLRQRLTARSRIHAAQLVAAGRTAAATTDSPAGCVESTPSRRAAAAQRAA